MQRNNAKYRSTTSASLKAGKKATNRRAIARINQIRRSAVPAIYRSSKGEVKALVISQTTAAPGGAALALNATGSIIPLNLIQAGSSFFNRIGRKVEMISVRFVGNFNLLNVSRATGADYARIVLVYDRQANGALPALADIFQDTEQSGTNTTQANSGINLNNRERFAVIADKRIMLPAVTTTAGVPSGLWPTSFDNDKISSVDMFRKLKGMTVHYGADSSPAVIGDIKSGSLLLVTFANIGAGAENFGMNQWNVRLRYNDV